MPKQPKPSSIEVLNSLIKKAQKLVRPLESNSAEYKKVAGYFEKNAHLPCSKCGYPARHKSKTGKVHTALCSKCFTTKRKLIG